MAKTIVTHMNPDLDAIASAWLLVRFLKSEYKDVRFTFVPAGETLGGRPADSDSDITHVDTGGGRFDHHDPQRTTLCSALLVRQYLIEKQPHLAEDEALKLMVEHVNEIDQFGDFFWPDPTNPRYAFLLANVIDGLHMGEQNTDEQVVGLVFQYLDATYSYMRDFVHAKQEIEAGTPFESPWGKGIGVETGNDAVMKVAQKLGYDIVVRKDPKRGFLRIKAAPKPEIDLQPLYDKILQVGGKKDWYFHPNKHMIFNGSGHNPYVTPTTLQVKDIITMVQELQQTERGGGRDGLSRQS